MSYSMPKFIALLNQLALDQNPNQYLEAKLSLENPQSPLKQLKDTFKRIFKDRECLFCSPAS